MRHALGSCGVARGGWWWLHGGPCALVVALFCPNENLIHAFQWHDLFPSHPNQIQINPNNSVLLISEFFHISSCNNCWVWTIIEGVVGIKSNTAPGKKSGHGCRLSLLCCDLSTPKISTMSMFFDSGFTLINMMLDHFHTATPRTNNW